MMGNVDKINGMFLVEVHRDFQLEIEEKRRNIKSLILHQ
jgi:hypothetical protein